METEFLDREDERAYFESTLPPQSVKPSITIVRGPSGFGKTTLTEWVARMLKGHRIPVIEADPKVHASTADHQTYQGFFVQRCIKAMEDERVQAELGVPTFNIFLQNRGWKNLKGYSPSKALKTIPTLNTAYSVSRELIERLKATGDYSAKALLQSDNSDVIEICAEYFRTVVAAKSCVLIIRETQHCDVMSLEEILRAHRQAEGLFIIMEYTSRNGALSVEHEKVFEDTFDDADKLKVIDLNQLPWPEVNILLERHAGGDRSVIGKFQANWDGNLRSVKMLKHTVAIGQTVSANAPNPPNLTDLTGSLQHAIGRLDRTSRFLLAVLAEHVEPVPKDVLTELCARLPSEMGMVIKLDDSLEALRAQETYLQYSETDIATANDDVNRAILAMDDHAVYGGLATQQLLSLYSSVLRDRTFAGSSFVQASRQAISLASRRHDLPALIGLLEVLDEEIRQTADPARYVGMIVDNALATEDIGALERNRLIDWAYGVSYRSSDFGKAVDILRLKGELKPSDQIVMAHCLIEIGEEEEARRIALKIRDAKKFADADLMCDLIIGNLDLVHMEDAACVSRLEETAAKAERRGSVLGGHAYRLLESAVGERTAIEYCKASIDLFEASGLEIPAAYSKLAVVRHYARLGDSEVAERMLDEAEPVLSGAVTSRQFLLNNRAGVELSKENPDYDEAYSILRRALSISRDDFSDLTILHNLLIAAWQLRRLDYAKEIAGQLERLIMVEGSTPRLLCVPVIAGLGRYHTAVESGESVRVLSILKDFFGIHEVTSEYWAWRLDETRQRPSCYPDRIIDKPFHPLYLSQWQIDQEVVTKLIEPSG